MSKRAGKLTAAIQKEWPAEMGTANSNVSEQVMHSSQSLLQAAAVQGGSISGVIGSGTVASFLGTAWVQAHPNLSPYIRALEIAEQGSHA